MKCSQHLRDVFGFAYFAEKLTAPQEMVVAWKKELLEKWYAMRSSGIIVSCKNKKRTIVYPNKLKKAVREAKEYLFWCDLSWQKW